MSPSRIADDAGVVPTVIATVVTAVAVLSGLIEGPVVLVAVFALAHIPAVISIEVFNSHVA